MMGSKNGKISPQITNTAVKTLAVEDKFSGDQLCRFDFGLR